MPRAKLAAITMSTIRAVTIRVPLSGGMASADMYTIAAATIRPIPRMAASAASHSLEGGSLKVGFGWVAASRPRLSEIGPLRMAGVARQERRCPPPLIGLEPARAPDAAS